MGFTSPSVRAIVTSTLALTLLLSSCSSATLIQSSPSGAHVYLNDQYVGTTPYQHEDTKVSGTRTPLRLELEGYEPLQTWLVRNEEADAGAIIGGIFFMFPFIWTLGYLPEHTYELQPLLQEPLPQEPMPAVGNDASQTMEEKLRALKKLREEDLITEEEYEAARKKALGIEE
ncbi:PEGA domain-containing protein [Catalinimonas alkaloidigena]|uniref:PEGA domain-containing protein n=1 Tax=Catalinimonas alkaloidigena TaxID=1075417 RepID=A0A1G9P9D8_9BACT|nr:PEGA domain-containing protein [Catalinimonas alkaloidigena]SDL95416.1 PEGA domain-containing protein [Catalinimonas alkaloidigena]